MWTMLPNRYRQMLEDLERKDAQFPEAGTRVVVDLIASLTERQAVTLFHQVSGFSAVGDVDPTGGGLTPRCWFLEQ